MDTAVKSWVAARGRLPRLGSLHLGKELVALPLLLLFSVERESGLPTPKANPTHRFARALVRVGRPKPDPFGSLETPTFTASSSALIEVRRCEKRRFFFSV